MNFVSQPKGINGGRRGQRGYTLLELVITLTVLAILVMGTIPMAQNAVQRQKEIQLRETLRRIRNAIDEFRRDAIGACPAGAQRTGNPGDPNSFGPVPSDPRSRVVIDDCTIFDTENLDRYPPSLDILVEGVSVKQRGIGRTGGIGLGGDTRNATDAAGDTEEKKKVYLRELPIDPMTNESDWRLRSSYQDADDDSWDDINVFDVRSNSTETALDGTKYNEW